MKEFKIIFLSFLVLACLFIGGLLAIDYLPSLDTETQKLYDRCKEKYKAYLRIEYIPFEFWEVRIFLKSDKIDSLVIKNLEKDIYDEEKKVGWRLLIIHNEKRNFLSYYYKERGFHKK